MSRNDCDGVGRMVDGKYIVTIDEITDMVSRMEGPELVKKLKGLRSVNMDFTDEYYAGVSVNNLRHIYLAAMTTIIKREESLRRESNP